MTTKEFHIGDILSVTTGRLVSPRHMDGIYEILNFMTGDSLFTHQLPRACDEMKPRLLAQHPQLSGITGDTCTPENHNEWLACQIEAFGETLPVRSEHQFHEVKDPIAEAEERFGPDRVIPIKIEP